MEFIGRLHPLIVHLPIGILLLAALLEVWSRFRGYKKLTPAVDIAVAIGSLAAIAACISGWILSEESGYEEGLLFQHKISGLATAVLSILLMAILFGRKLFKKKERKKVRLIAFFPMVVLVFITGHLGGSLTHGSDFLFSSSEEEENTSKPDYPKITLEADQKIYEQLIRPLLEEKCYDCHSSKKQKGKLRLDSKEWILKGGKNGSIIDLSHPEESDMLRRINLSLDDDDHMPPRKKTQLSSGELDIIEKWIESGASFTNTLSDVKDSLVFVNYIQSVNTTASNDNWWLTDKIEKPDESEIEKLSNQGISVNFLSQESNYLQVSFVMYDTFPPNVWNNLTKLKNNIASLRLSDISLTKTDLNNLVEFKNLRKLYIDKSTVDDNSLEKILSLTNLVYLNLSGDSITDQGLKKLLELKSLKHLFLFDTNCTAKGVKSFKESVPDCEIEFSQYEIPFLTTDTLEYRKK